MAVPTPPTDVTIRPVEAADLRAVVRIERASFAEPWPHAAFERFLEESGFLVAARDDEVVGFVVGDVSGAFGRAFGHVKDLAVAPTARRGGIGRSLLVRSLVTLATAGADLVKLEVRESNAAAIDLYRDLGFETAQREAGYYRDGEDALVMVVDVDERWP